MCAKQSHWSYQTTFPWTLNNLQARNNQFCPTEIGENIQHKKARIWLCIKKIYGCALTTECRLDRMNWPLKIRQVKIQFLPN